MKNSRINRNLWRLATLGIALFALTVLSSARTATTSVNIVNNSNKEIRNVYLSHVNVDDWGGNQLGDATILPGQAGPGTAKLRQRHPPMPLCPKSWLAHEHGVDR